MASERFTTIFDVVDKSLEIIIDNNTGYYNITKIIKHIENNGSEVTGNFKLQPTGCSLKNNRNKQISTFLKTNQTKELIKAIKIEYNIKTDDIDNLTYKLNIEKAYSGTYIHKTLFDHALSWINKSYAIKISKILDECRNEYNLKLKYENKELTNKNNELNSKVDTLLGDNKDLKQQIKELMIYAKDTNSQITDLNDTVGDLNDTVDNLNNKIDRVLPDVNVKPNNENDVQKFMLIKVNNTNYKIHIGSVNYLEKKINGYTNDKNNNKLYKNASIVVQPIYNPNPTSLRTRIREAIKLYCSNLIDEVYEQYKNKEIDETEKVNSLRELKTNSPIKITGSSIKISVNFDVVDFYNIVINSHNNRTDDNILNISLDENNNFLYSEKIDMYEI